VELVSAASQPERAAEFATEVGAGMNQAAGMKRGAA
jgi:hypothetical protein